MLIPNLKFLVLPLVALTVIAFLPASGSGERQVRTRGASLAAKTVGCEQPVRLSRCVVAANLSLSTVVMVR